MPSVIPVIIDEFEKGKITLDEFKQKIENPVDSKPLGIVHVYNPAEEAHPSTINNNKSHDHLKYDIYHHPKGKLLQTIKSKFILGALNAAHSLWLKKYDVDAFKYDDPRLISLDAFLKEYISINWTQNGYDNNYKGKFMFKLVDILCGLCKEDIYYRVRIFDLINKFTGRIVFELSFEEEENLRIWR